MKKLILIISSLTLLIVLCTNNKVMSTPIPSANDSIHIWSSSSLHDLTDSWASAYRQTNQESIIIISSSPKEVQGELNTSKEIGFITKEQIPQYNSASTWRMVVGRDVIVPIVNPDNPYWEQISMQGISPSKFAGIYTASEKQSWGALLNTNQTNKINCYFIEDKSTKAFLSNFMHIEANTIKGNSVSGPDELFKNISNDKYAIGFCRLADILDFENQDIDKAVKLIPIDLNENNKVDHFEDIYSSSESLARGIWIGKYPKTLYSNIYAVRNTQPTENEELALLEWVLTDGQQHLQTMGYSELIPSERLPKVRKLYTFRTPSVYVQYKPMLATTILLIMFAALALIFILFLVVRYIKSRTTKEETEIPITASSFSELTLTAPAGLFYDKSHTWAFMESDGFVRVGIDDFLQHLTGNITRVKMKTPGARIKKGETFLSIIQEGKQLDIFSPVSGIIKENNSKLNNNTSLINEAPYKEGWIYVFEANNWLKEIKDFMMGVSYSSWLKIEFSRLKDFLSTALSQRQKDVHELYLVLQEGGEVKDKPLERLGPEAWEEFQRGFINPSK